MYGPTTDKISVVKTRLEFIRRLIEFRALFRYDIRQDMNGFISEWKSPYREYSALRFYLALTCFDALGQVREYITFDKWIKSKKYRDEVNEAIKHAQNESSDFLKVTQYLHSTYNRHYSMQNAFKRFVFENLDEADRKQLFHSIKIRKILLLDNGESKEDTSFTPSNNQKFKFLVSVRNYYTHKSIPTGLLYLGEDKYDEDEPRNDISGLENKLGYCPIRMEKHDTFYYEYSVRAWPKLLISLVEKTIEKIENENL